jgi:hypothetical protein
MTGIGSYNLWLVLAELDQIREHKRAKATEGANQETQEAISNMKKVAGRRLSPLLLARFLLLNLLV